MTGSNLQYSVNYRTACGENACVFDELVEQIADRKIEEVLPPSEMAALSGRPLGVRLLIDVTCDGTSDSSTCNPRVSRVDLRPISRLIQCTASEPFETCYTNKANELGGQ